MTQTLLGQEQTVQTPSASEDTQDATDQDELLTQDTDVPPPDANEEEIEEEEIDEEEVEEDVIKEKTKKGTAFE